MRGKHATLEGAAEAVLIKAESAKDESDDCLSCLVNLSQII
jgi:hypothetical protein